MQREQNTHVLWQIRACAVSAVYLPLLGCSVLGQALAGQVGQAADHSVGVPGAKAHSWQFWTQSGLCVWL